MSPPTPPTFPQGIQSRLEPCIGFSGVKLPLGEGNDGQLSAVTPEPLLRLCERQSKANRACVLTLCVLPCYSGSGSSALWFDFQTGNKPSISSSWHSFFGLWTIEIYFSQFWRLEGQDWGSSELTLYQEFLSPALWKGLKEQGWTDFLLLTFEMNYRASLVARW